jgi:site-specific DNA recombinase
MLAASVNVTVTDSPVRVGVYLRQSLDKDADTPAKARAAVRRQSEQCDQTIGFKSKIAASEGKPGWFRADTYEDNSKSAAKAGRRDEFARMLADVRAGRLDVVMAKHVDRLTRNLKDLITLTEACQEHGVLIVTVEGDMDLNSPMGRMIVTILAAVARAEIERKAERQLAANAQRVADGMPSKSAGKRLGYSPDDFTVIRREAVSVRKAYDLLVKGSSLVVIAAYLNERGHLTSQENPWTPDSVRDLLLNPLYGGRLAHRGEIAGPSAVPAIVKEETWDAAHAILMDAARLAGKYHGGRRPKFLLSALATCGVCGRTLCAGSMKPRNGDRIRIYLCASRKHIGQQITRLDEYVLGELAQRLAAPDAMDLLADERPDTAPLRHEAAILRARLDELAAEWADPSTTMNRRQFGLANSKITTRLEEISAQMTASEHAAVLDGVIKPGDPGAVLAVLRGMDVARQQAILAAVAEVTVHPAGSGNKIRYQAGDTVEMTFRR